jgi:uncharacterized protein YecT (DUF1311 family)
MNYMKRIAILLCVVVLLLCGGCSTIKEQTEVSVSELLTSTESQETDAVSDTEAVSEAEEESETKSIQAEMEEAESLSWECYESVDQSDMGQQEINQLTAQWYQFWDDEMNFLWDRLSEEVDEETEAELLEEQQAWLQQKEEAVKNAGAAFSGGSLQAQLENMKAEEMTRARAYVLAGYLAEVRGESFTISPEIQESLDAMDTIGEYN